MNNQIVDQMIDNTTRVFTSMFWMQEQGDKFVQTWMEQNRVSREQATQMAERIGAQAKENQRLLPEMVQQSVKASFDNYQAVSKQTIEQLQKQVELLSNQVQELNARAAAAVKA